MADVKNSTRLRIPGTEIVGTLPTLPAGTSGQVSFREVRSFQISAARAGAAEAPVLESRADDIVEVELEDGSRFWTSQERLRTEVLNLAESRAADGVVELPATLARPSAARGLFGRIVIKTLKFFRIDVAEMAARLIAEKLEHHLLGDPEQNRGPGLYRILPGDELRLEPVAEAVLNLPQDRPSLLLLHGTASSTAGSFGKLWSEKRRQQREQLLTLYEGRIFALEHETLSKNPIDNAIAAAERLPPGARLHLVSHSRGGMVGELLCRAGSEAGRDPFDAGELSWFKTLDPEAKRGDLERLNSLLRAKRLRIERFVRVACPARGTTLASGRLDIYLSVLFNLLEGSGFLAALPLSLFTSLFSELIMAVAKERSDPAVLPGIEAMIPSSPLVALLNRATLPVAGELRVVAGDLEGENALSAIGTLLTDPLYQDDNDLVVNTDSMFGGAERSGGAAFLFRRGGDVNHFSYFENADSAEGLARALSRSGAEGDGFEPFSVRDSDSGEPPYAKRELVTDQPVVFVLPGIMGSHLAIDDNRIWLDPLDIARGKFGLLRYGTPNLIQAQSPLWMFYGNLVKHLSNSHRVLPFPFDWRLSVFEEGRRLAAAVGKALDESEGSRQPVCFVAHSMGGLVVRAMLAEDGALWQRLQGRHGSRIVMLGTPNGGSHAVTQVLTGRDSLIRKLALLDASRRQQELIGIVGQFPGLLEMLPATGNLDLFEPQRWQELAAADPQRDSWQPPAAATLTAARAMQEKLAQAPIDPERMFYIAGCAPATPCELAIEADGAKQRLVFYATPRGDGRVPWESGTPAGVKSWYLQAAHGDLPNCEEGFAAITELLRSGNTTLLPTTPPESRGVAEKFELPAEPTTLYPDFTDLARTATGADRIRRQRHSAARIAISVRHGNLAFAAHPVLVGHYKGDTIISAEAYLDRTLDGRLTARHRLRLYPGEEETAEVFLNPDWEQSGKADGKPPGAIVIGLGEVGELSPGRLMRAVSRGVRAYALSRAECPQAKGSQSGPGLSLLLVGTGAGGISVQDSVNAILRGIGDANRSIGEAERSNCRPIETVEFVELYEDRAIQAARTLARLRLDPEIARTFAIEPEPRVVPLAGGKRRASFMEEESWWQRLQINENEDELLSFNLLTDRARAEVRLQQSQRSLADRFIETMSATTASDQGVAITLFEMLIPNELKEYAPDRRDLVLVLNPTAARYPWEMMQERRRGEATEQTEKPLAVQAGMVRQLQVEQFRERVVMARDKTALVVGNPPTPFTPLPEAEQEAREVVKALKADGYLPTALIGAEAEGTRILQELFARDYRIVHLAGHGVFEYQPPQPCAGCSQPTEGKPISGMIIGENQFLTAAQIHQLRTVPQLVFVNCCHLGKIDGKQPPPNHPSYLAANLAAELIQMGVRAVVAAGWAVQDDAAALFAATFYREILAGVPFGEAVLAARIATYTTHPEVNTWGAYQCYGDPDFVLGKGDGTRSHHPRRLVFSALSEAIVELENIAAAAKTAAAPPLEVQLKLIANIEQSLPPAWLGCGALQAALGQAYGELNRFEPAVAHYRKALADAQALAPIKAVEQLWNLQSRWAKGLAAGDPARALTLVREAEQKLLELKQALGATGERLALLGSVAKRRLMIATEVAEKRGALYAMADYYRAAYALGVERGQPDYYPLVNALTAQTLGFLLEEKGALPEDFFASLDQAAELAQEQQRRAPDFWNTVAATDCLLLRHLAAGDLAEAGDAIVFGYLKARNVASPREFSSVQEHLDFLLTVISTPPENRRRRDLAAFLQQIRLGLDAGPEAIVAEPLPYHLDEASLHFISAPAPVVPPGFRIRLKKPARRSAPTRGEEPPTAGAEPPPEMAPKMSEPLDEAEEELQPVQLGASAPRQVKPGSEFSARFVAYEKRLEQEVKELLTKLAPSAETVLGIQECRWKRGTAVTVRLSGRGLGVDPAEQQFLWQGGTSLLTFDLSVPEEAEEETIPLKFDVAIEGIIVARLRLELEITAKARKKGQATASGEPARTAFASYSSKDRLRVLDRVDAIKIAAGIDVFQDCLDLNPGEEWKPRLDQEIRERDLFLLFWSKNSSESKWVGWELETALKEKGEQALQLHPLDPGVKPPHGLERLNIGSVAMWVRKGFEAVQQEKGRQP